MGARGGLSCLAVESREGIEGKGPGLESIRYSRSLHFLCCKWGECWDLPCRVAIRAVHSLVCVCLVQCSRGAKGALSGSQNHFILSAADGFGTRTAVVIRCYGRGISLWTGYRLEAGRPRESGALAGTNGRKRKALGGPGPQQ